MHHRPSPRRYRQHRLILALYLVAAMLVLLAWLAGAPATPIA